MQPPIVAVDNDGHCLIFGSVADAEGYLRADDIPMLTACDADGRALNLRPADRGKLRITAPPRALAAPDHLSELLVRALEASGIRPDIHATPDELFAVASRLFTHVQPENRSLIASIIGRGGTRRVGLREVRIELAHHSEGERRAQWQLELLLVGFDVTPWIGTPRVVIDDRATPHSHPVLTLHARHTNDPMRLLSTFLHEQIHWLIAPKRGEVRAATADLKRRYPQVAVEPPEGAGDRASSYLHLIVNWLEFVALRDLAGEEAARDVFDFWTRDHYRALYRTVLADFDPIGEILTRHNLHPITAPPA